EGAAQQHDDGDQRDREGESPEIAAREHLADQPAEQRQPPDSQPDGDEPDDHGPEDAQAYAFGECPETRLEMHGAILGKEVSEAHHSLNAGVRQSTISKISSTFLYSRVLL